MLCQVFDCGEGVCYIVGVSVSEEEAADSCPAGVVAGCDVVFEEVEDAEEEEEEGEVVDAVLEVEEDGE